MMFQMSSLGVCVVLFLFSFFGQVNSQPYQQHRRLVVPDECEVLVYANITEAPSNIRDTAGTCPDGGGPRAFLLDFKGQVPNVATSVAAGGVPLLKEVAPKPRQNLRCVSDGARCYIPIQGLGLRAGDGLVLVQVSNEDQALSSHDCPPTQEGSSAAVVKVEAEAEIQTTSVARYDEGQFKETEKDAAYAVFPLMTSSLERGISYAMCVAPSLASQSLPTEELKEYHFHYKAGVLRLSLDIFSCDFDRKDGSTDEKMCGFQVYRDHSDVDLKWKIGTGATRTPNTGPSGDHTSGRDGKGSYVFMDAPGFTPGSTAVLVGQPLVFPPGPSFFCVQWAYHMYGQDVSAFRVYLHELPLHSVKGVVPEKILLGNWGTPRWVAVGDKGDEWHLGGFDFQPSSSIRESAGRGGPTSAQLVLEAVAGNSQLGDIAVDDLRVTSGRCPAHIRKNMPLTSAGSSLVQQSSRFGSSLVCGEVRLLTGSDASDKAWYLEGAVSCAGRGYSLDQLNQTAWLPCCVPHFGSYKLILQDQFGDGWKGSKLQFRFFDRVLTFGEDDFQIQGTDKVYDVIIGLIEVESVKANETQIEATVRTVRGNSYVWCGVVATAADGGVSPVNLSPELLRRYGVRSASPTEEDGDSVAIILDEGLKPHLGYDLYCYSEVVGEDLAATDTVTMQMDRKMIAASRIRVSTDGRPPILKVESVEVKQTEVEVSFTVNEAAKVWCLAKYKPIEDAAETLDPDALVNLIKRKGNMLEVEEPSADEARSRATVKLTSLFPDSSYDIFCFAEDKALPRPNVISPETVLQAKKTVTTKPMVPRVQIVRHNVVPRGFQVFVKTNAPGQVWCAAAPKDFGLPTVEDIRKAGVTRVIEDVRDEVVIEVKGVKQNSKYTIYCLGGSRPPRRAGAKQIVMSASEMHQTALEATSFGKFCEIPSEPRTFAATLTRSVFEPLAASEEFAVREFMMSRSELNLEGVYRINLFLNKSAIYEYLDHSGPLPQRFARVRVGRCLDNEGSYEQYKVGPIAQEGESATESLAYSLLGAPVKTTCGGYNPQGLFGRRRRLQALSEEEISAQKEAKRLTKMMVESFGHPFGDAARCGDDMFFGEEENKPKHEHHTRRCLRPGPIIIVEDPSFDAHGSQCEIGSADCSNQSNDTTRAMVGLKTPSGDSVPFYFVYRLAPREPKGEPSALLSNEEAEVLSFMEHSSTLKIPKHLEWVPDGVWYNGALFDSMEEMLDAYFGTSEIAIPENFEKVTPQLTAARRLSSSDAAHPSGHRMLQPSPFPGAAGTGGPLPSRQKRRSGLEHRAHPEHVEPQGKRFTVRQHRSSETYSVEYAGWTFTVTNDRDTSLKIWNLRFRGALVAFEVGLMEALAHYTVSERNFFFLDSWYGGLGAAARKVFKGIEVPKTALCIFHDESLCIFEQDLARPIRSHFKSGGIRDGAPHLQLVLRQMLTVSNYDYVTDYYFHLSGNFEATVSFTGELYAGIEVPWYSSRQAEYGTQVTGAMRLAALHNHMAVWKCDFDINDYRNNSVLFAEVVPDNLRFGANQVKRFYAETERDAAYFRNDSRNIHYDVVDETTDLFGNVGGWRVLPARGINPRHHDFELYTGPAAWGKYAAFSTVFKYDELEASLPRDNKYAQSPAVSVDRYIGDNESIRNVDVVTWIADGIFHLPVVEDMPLTLPIGNTLGFMGKPANLFVEDPTMDLHNGMGGDVKDPGTCAVIRHSLAEIEPVFAVPSPQAY